MIGIVGGGLAAAKIVEGYREAGGTDRITIWSHDPHGPYHRPPLSKRLLRGEAEPADALVHPRDWYGEQNVDLRLESGEIPEGADLVVAGIGVQPNVELAQAAGLEVRNGVVVNERFETSKPGVYAVGDVAEFFDPLFRRHRRIEHWSNSAYHGTTLGKILAGEDTRYDTVSSFFTEQFGRSFKSFGDPLGHDATALEGDFRGERAVFRFSRAGNVVGAVTTGLDEDAENALRAEIRAGAAATG